MVVGTIASNSLLAAWLTVKSEWKPGLDYSLDALKKMFSFSAWTLLESLSSWLASWAGTFILGMTLNSYYLGLYKTSTSLVSSIVAVVSSAVIPVVFSTLSRFQSDREAFNAFVYKMQYWLALFLVPLASCIFVFRDSLVYVLLGENWLETALFVGLYGAASSIVIVYGYVASEAYRALGQPRLCLLVQISYILMLVPTLYFSSLAGYECMSVVYPLIRALGFTAIHLIVCRTFLGLSALKMLTNLKYIFLATFIEAVLFYYLVGLVDNYYLQLLLTIPAVMLYLLFVWLFPETHGVFVELLDKLGLSGLFAKLKRGFTGRKVYR